MLLHLLALLVVGLLLAGGIFLWGMHRYAAPGPLPEETLFVIKKGSGVSLIADRLKAAAVIDDPVLFRVAARLTDTDKSLKAGEYRFTAHESLKDVLQKLHDGQVVQRQFTVPEGLTSWQVVQLLGTVEELKGEIADIPDEGSLLPETYNFMLGESRADKIAQMQQAMQQTQDELWAGAAADSIKLSSAEVLTLASIVEKETAVPDERRRIAGVFVNRLNKAMPLQTDPTVIYALTKGKIQNEGKGPLGRRLLRKDLEVDSPYNTYKYPGLPPGPIANPGRASIEAVLNPEQHNFLYFVADGTGGHVFSETLAEHNRNAAQWRKIRKQSGN